MFSDKIVRAGIVGLMFAALAIPGAWAQNTSKTSSKPLNTPAPTAHKPYGKDPSRNIVADSTVEGGKALRLTVPAEAAKPWNAGIYSFVGGKIKAGDRVNTTVWLKTVQAPADKPATVALILQKSAAPHTEYGKAVVTLIPEWKAYSVDAVVTEDAPAYSTMFSLQAGYGAQTVDIGPVYVRNLGAGN